MLHVLDLRSSVFIAFAFAACGTEDSSESSLAERCEAQLERADCEAVEGVVDDMTGVSGFCVWESSVPVVLSGGTCDFGAPQGRCVVETASGAGCAGGGVHCGADPGDALFGFLRTEDEQTVLVEGRFCVPDPATQCIVEEDGTLQDGPAECACFCDPAFPAAP